MVPNIIFGKVSLVISSRSYWIPGSYAPPWSEKRTSLLKAIAKEGLQGGKGDNSWVGRHRHIHDPGIQQEPLLIAHDGWGGRHIAHRIAPFRNAEAHQGRPHQRQRGEGKSDIISPGEIVQLPGQPDTQPSPDLVRE